MNSDFYSDSFCFLAYDKDNPEHVKALEKLLSDPLVDEYFNSLESNLEDEDTFWDSAYLVSNYDEIIGYLAIFMDAKEAELHYAVVPEFRGIRNNSNETIGCQIVREASIGLFRRCKSLKYLKLMIEKSNIRSTKMALRAGYKQVEKGFYNKFTLSREDAMSLQMTEFKTDNFIFFRFNPTNDNEMKAVNTLLNDRYVQKYLGNVDIRDFLLASRDDDEISDSSFLVGFNDEIVGYLSTFSGLDAIDLDYAVLPQFRGKKVNERDTYGALMIKEASSELFRRYAYVKFLRVYINESNVLSLEMAKKIGFEVVRDGFSPYELHMKRQWL